MSEEFKFKFLVEKCKIITSIQRHYVEKDDGLAMIETPFYHHKFSQVTQLRYIAPLEIASEKVEGFHPDKIYEVEITMREVKDE